MLSQNNLNSKAKNLLDIRKFKMDLPLGLTILLKFKSMLMVMVPMIYLGITVLSSVSKSSRGKCIIWFAFVLLQWMDAYSDVVLMSRLIADKLYTTRHKMVLQLHELYALHCPTLLVATK